MSEPHSLQMPTDSCGPACEGDVLIIEVIGKDHPEGHRFRWYDATNREQQEWMEQQVNVERIETSTLHVWPAPSPELRNVWLDIDAEQGQPIRVPLFSGVTATPRQLAKQWNRVCPIIPVTRLHAHNPPLGAPKSHLAPLRSGYVYIFQQGRLWRELEVSPAGSDAQIFRDIRISDYRNPGQAGLTEDRRPAVGKPLDAVWLPLAAMNRSVMADIQMAFSEVQWSSERIAYMETDNDARRQRCSSLQGDASDWTARPLSEGAPGEGWMIPLSNLPSVRTREPFLEQHLLEPWRSVVDLEGNHAHQLFVQAEQEQQAFNAGGEQAEDAWEAAGYRDAPLRGNPAIRAAAFAANATQGGGQDESRMWQPLGAASDLWVDAKDRSYGAVVLDDALFRLRQSLTLALAAQRYLTTVLGKIDQTPYSDSAQVVQQVMGPERLGGQENPLHAYLENIDTGLFGPLHRTLRTAERQLAVEELAQAQKRLADLVRQHSYQGALADLFSLTCADYIEGFAVSRDLFQALAVDPNTADPLSCTAVVSDAQVRDANELILSIVQEGSDQPLHRMLIPADSPEQNREASASGQCGDGRCRPQDLEQLPRETPDDSGLQTLTAVSLLAVAKTNDLNLATEAKRWMSAVNGILDSLDQQIRALVQRLTKRTFNIRGRFYGPLLKMLKAREPTLLGPMQMVARNAVPQGWIMLGLYDPETGQRFGLTEGDREYIHQGNRHRRFYGRFHDAEGNPLASTRKGEVPDMGAKPEARNLQVFAAPEDSEVVRNYRAMKRMEGWQKVADSLRIPYVVLALEMTNIWQEGALYQKTQVQKGSARARLGVLSALADLGIAGVFAAERLGKDIGVWNSLSAGLNKEAFKTTNPVFQRLFPVLAKALPEVVTRRMLGGIVSGGLAMTVSLLDMGLEFDTGDYDAAAAHGLAAVGGGMTMMGGFMLASMGESGVAPLLLGLGPGAWVAIGLTLAIGAGVAAVLLDDPPLVDWLARGPFGNEQDDLYPHLKGNSGELYYRLLGLLSVPRIHVEPVHDVHVALASEGYLLEHERLEALSRINTKVTVENNLAAIMDDTRLTVRTRAIQVTRRQTRRGTRVERQLQDTSPTPVLQQAIPNGRVLYFSLPDSRTYQAFLNHGGEVSTELAIRAQWQADWPTLEQCAVVAFPAPPLEDDTVFDAGTHGTPDFTLVEQPFWADEQTHKPEDAE